MNDLLPIGSVVLLKGTKQKILIVGFRGVTEDSSEVYDYIGYPYPSGFMSRDMTLLFNHNVIEEIFCEGYKSKEEVEFKENLKKYISNQLSETGREQ